MTSTTAVDTAPEDAAQGPWEGQEGTCGPQVAPDAYTAANIRVPTEAELVARCDWLHADVLAKQYPQVTHAFLGRLLEACRLSGFDQHLAVRLYLDGDRTIIPTTELIAAHTELSDQRPR
jgi:hypothetical protein